MYNLRGVFNFVRTAEAAGQRVVLVTIVAVSGTSSRDPGTHLAVREDGQWFGTLSGGCIEAAVAAESLAALGDGKPRLVRYGAGSPYLDIRLPCGGGIDLLFNPLGDKLLGERLIAALDARARFTLSLPRAAGAVEVHANCCAEGVTPAAQGFSIGHRPPLRIALFGQGGAAECLLRLGQGIGADLFVASPDAALVEAANRSGAEAHVLSTPEVPAAFHGDAWTAAVLLFHDHDWEPPLLAPLLKQPLFYLGAMGSLAAHGARLEALRAIGFDEMALARIVAPIGLLPSQRDPESLAVSVLAQLVERFAQITPVAPDQARPN